MTHRVVLRDRTFVAGVAASLLCYNVVVSLTVSPSASIATNVVLAAILVLAASARGLSLADLGLRDRGVGPHLLLGFVLGIATFAVALIGTIVGTADTFGSEELDDLTGVGLWIKLLFHAPFATATVEEMAFRGVLLSSWRRAATPSHAIVGSSAVYGLWHIPSTIAKLPRAPLMSFDVAIPVAISLIGTFVLGQALGWLRARTGSIWMGVPIHAGFNVGGVVGVVLER